MKKLISLLLVQFLLSCKNEISDYIAYARFDEYNLKPSEERTKLAVSAENYILFKKEDNNNISLLLMPDEKNIVYQYKKIFWYCNQKSEPERGTNSTNIKETFIANDTIYKVETLISESGKLEWQGLIVKTRGKDFLYGIEPFIEDTVVEGRFQKIKSFSADRTKCTIYLKELNSDTLFTFRTNNDHSNLIRDCISSVDVLDKLGEFGRNFYAGETITSWFIEKKPNSGDCKY